MGSNKNKKFIAGIDIGTTNIKGCLFSVKGELINKSSFEYESISPEKNFHEQNPKDWVDGFLSVLKDICKTTKVKKNLIAISISTQGGTIVPVDKDYEPLHNAITWLDRRGEKIFNDSNCLRKKNIDFYIKTGWRLDTNISFMPLFWLKKNRNEIFKNINKVFYVNDFLIKKFTGMNYQDPSNASMTLFYNIKEGAWDKEILKLIGLKEYNFSEVRSSGEIIGFLNKKISEEIGFKNEVAIVNGGHDQYCSALGAGIFDENEMLLATGTAWVVFKKTNKPITDPEYFFSVGRNIIKEEYGLIYTIPAAGASIKWLALNLMNLKNEKELFKIIDKNINEFEKIKNNIIYYPYLTGNFGPDFDISRKASLLNLEIGHDYKDIAKAIMEGIGFQLKKILTVFEKQGMKIDRIKMVGGATKSNIWPNIISDITCKDILITSKKNIDFACRGAAILAGYGAGEYKSLHDGFDKIKTKFNLIETNKKNTKFYKEKYCKFIKS
jgi:xylulokinase